MGERKATAWFNADTASDAFNRASIENPTILGEHVLDRAQYSLPSPAVACSVISVSHTESGVAAVNRRPTRSSWTGGPDLRFN
ncbi:hypothetical protein GCM10011610_64290 [Nocardia rhizosphaerihabitans]|uniref:Uncharacterized protein n=1 Tax=Nocardia rhizosphaerihabitans TaxID=1691570 RepID=A0ABQ2L079_9NOCA|nr:hypothetical protein GCM10011610_64290 [Nocardia rhizosphaerihabitans]